MKSVPVLMMILTSLLACSQPAPAAPAASTPAQPPTLKAALVSKTALQWPLLIADSKGFFTQENVAPDIVFISTAANLIQQLGTGSLDMGQVDAAAVIRAVEKGAPLKFAAGGINAALYRLMAQPDVRSAADLRGKTLTVDSPTGQPKYMTQLLLRSQGLNDNEYSFVFSGSTTDRYSQL